MASEKTQASFVSMCPQFLDEVNNSMKTGDTSNVKAKWNSFDAKDAEKRACLEQSLRDKIIDFLSRSYTGSQEDILRLIRFVDVVMSLCKLDMCAAGLSVSLLNDIFDYVTVPVCERLFEFVESHVTTWKGSSFFSQCKNNILRMCNDLLKRLSTAQNTVFRGRILMFLAMFFPFSERSGLNVVSEFNIDKDSILKYGVDVEDTEEEPLQTVDVQIKLDTNFYSEFWSLQEYFRSPTQCYSQWKDFAQKANAVLTVFKNYKVTWDTPMSDEKPNKNDVFFTKFLTSQKLLLLQLSDTDFRRTIYIQFLILFQFLTAQIKTKQDSYELKTSQVEWVKTSTNAIYQLIKDSPPNGPQFLDCVKLMLKREEHWSSWKNDGCPALSKVMTHYDPSNKVEIQPAKKTVADVLYEKKCRNLLVIPKNDSTECLDMRQDYLKCLPGRNSAPSVNEFLAEAIQQSESPEPIDAKDRKVNDERFAWIALKLLSLKSPHFFSVNQNPIPKLPDFVDHICRRMFREQNPGMLLPPLMPAPKIGGKVELKKASSSSSKDKAASAGKVHKVKVLKSANGKMVKTVSGSSSTKVAKSASDSDALKQAKLAAPKVPSSTTSSSSASLSEKKLSGSSKPVEKLEKEKSIDRTEKARTSSISSVDKSDKLRSSSSEKTDSARNSSVKTSPSTSSTAQASSLMTTKKIESKSTTTPVSSEKSMASTRVSSSSSSKRDKTPPKRKRDLDEKDPSPGKRIKEKKDDRKDDDFDDDLTPSLTAEQISKLAKSISGSWKKVADALGYKSEEMEGFEQQEDSDYTRALNLLLMWTNADENASPENLKSILKNLGMTEAAKILSNV